LVEFGIPTTLWTKAKREKKKESMIEKGNNLSTINRLGKGVTEGCRVKEKCRVTVATVAQ